MLTNCNIYGGSIYGQIIYHEYCTATILYDFEITVHDLESGNLIDNIHWALYRRDTSISLQEPIDESHILVADGTNVSGLLRINLEDYSLKNDRTDFFIKAWRDENPEYVSSVYVRYYPSTYDDYTYNTPYLVSDVYLKTSCINHGVIQIDPDRWQMVSVPVQFGYWDKTSHKLVHDNVTPATVKNYIIDQIEDVYGIDAKTYIEVMNTYIGDINKFYNYVVGVTQDASEHNFKLAYRDGSNVEYTGLWIKSIIDVPFDIQWGGNL